MPVSGVKMAAEGECALAGSTHRGLIADRARRDPGAVALLAPGRPPLAFGALLAQVERVARSLAGLGLGRGDRIALALPTGPELAVTLLAISDCATCLPLNPALEETAWVRALGTARIDALIVADEDDSAAARVARTLRLPVLRAAFRAQDPVGTLDLVGETGRAPKIPEPVQPDDIALLMQTSGTTARPKSVPIAHRTLGASIINQIDALQLTSADRSLAVTPFYTNAGIRRSLYAPLVVGGSVVCTPGFQASAFFDWLEELAPTYYAAGPAIHLELLAEIERRGRAPRHRLRFVWSGATALSAALEDRLERALGGVPIIQAYGMCEAGQVACNPLPPGRRRPESVGKPVATELAVFDDARRVLPSGRSGEIWVRGPAVISGYEDDPDLDREAFHDGWFRTGDLGYIDEDGYVFLAGRVKEQINRGGMKVSPAEVDAVLRRHPEVVDAACFAVAHPTLGEDVAAAVVLRNTAAATPQQLRDFAFAGLAAFKVPSLIVVVAELPRTARGKINRRTLAHALADNLRPGYVAPSTAQERIVARLFAEVLGVDRIGAHDNFFDLGGDSLRGTQVVIRVRATLGLDLDPGIVFRRPTVAEFALELERGGAHGGMAAAPPIVSGASLAKISKGPAR